MLTTGDRPSLVTPSSVAEIAGNSLNYRQAIVTPFILFLDFRAFGFKFDFYYYAFPYFLYPTSNIVLWDANG